MFHDKKRYQAGEVCPVCVEIHQLDFKYKGTLFLKERGGWKVLMCSRQNCKWNSEHEKYAAYRPSEIFDQKYDKRRMH